MKKLFMVLAVVMLAVLLSGCSKGKFDYEDGVYFAAADRVAGQTYRYWTEVTIKDKKITKVVWNAYHVDGAAAKCKGDDKFTCSEDGNYGNMGGQKGDWHEQAKKTTDWIVKNQKIGKDLKFTDDKADAITSVSVTTKELFDLIDEALENGPVAKGDYEDGYYYVETALSDKTVTYAVLNENTTDEYLLLTETFKTSTMGTFIVANGTIVLADFNARHDAYVYETDANGKFKTYTVGEGEEAATYNIIKGTGKEQGDKIVLTGATKYVTKDSAGKWYGMSDTGKIEWDIQANHIESFLLTNQGLTIKDGKIDGLSNDASTGASVSQGGFVSVWNLFVEKAGK